MSFLKIVFTITGHICFFFLFHLDTFRISGCRQQSATLQSLDFCQFPSRHVAAALGSVPGLVLVVPSVEVVVEEDDASRRHASYDAPVDTQRETVSLNLLNFGSPV